MCIRPLTLADGVVTACHECWQCIENRVNDWVGRCIAESRTAVGTHAITLTYGRNRVGDVDHERSNLLTYSDVQNYLKLYRRHGFPVRYFVTGEKGSMKGRAHWHIILFWQEKVPPICGVHNETHKWLSKATGAVGEAVRFWHQRLDDKGEPAFYQNGEPAYWWPHGFSEWTEGTSAANIRYNCKYVQKDLHDAERQGHLAMSKKPPIGARYFAQMAERYVKAEIAPQDLFYSFPEVRTSPKKGAQEVIQFLLKDRSAELFLEHYIRTWRAVHGSRPWPESELVEAFDESRLATGWAEPARRELPQWQKQSARKPRVWRDDIDVREAMEKAHGQGPQETAYYVKRAENGHYFETETDRAERLRALRAKAASQAHNGGRDDAAAAEPPSGHAG